MEKVSLLPPGRLGWWKGLSVEKNCQLAKREGLGNANLIPIEQAMGRGVTQGRVEENWSSRMMLRCGWVSAFTQSASWLLSLIAQMLCHSQDMIWSKNNDDIEHLPTLFGNVLEHHCC